MPDTISLRAYIQNVDKLLHTGATDEVTHHCRHILQHFPRNVAVYRLLGQAYLQSNKWDEANTVLRRVLSVLPDDYTAHVGLSEVYSHHNRANDAIWHLERAYEQNPNNKEIIERLRDLYKRHHSTEHTRLQLTTAAVARQYARNGLYDQAADTLRGTLERMPDRVDLRLLLAETLWGADRNIQAGEAAMDVLQVLPDCLGANRIMTQLWLAEGRPSDAQRYLSRLESIDPYLALELAQDAAPDDAFTLTELDFQRYAQAQLATSQPEWLQQMGSADNSEDFESFFANEPPPPTQNWQADFQQDQVAQEQPPAAPIDEMPENLDDLFGDMSDDDWMTEADDAQGVEVAQEMVAADDDDPFGDFDDDSMMQDLEDALAVEQGLEQPDAEPEAGGLPDWLTGAKSREPEQSQAEEAEMWLGASDSLPAEEVEEVEDAEEASLQNDTVDPLGWLRDSGVEIDDAGTRASLLTGEEESAIDVEEQDPMAWMAASGVELTEDDDPFAESDDGEPLAAFDADRLDDAVESGDDLPDGETVDDDLFNWLQDDSTQASDDGDLLAPDPKPVSKTEAFDNAKLLELQNTQDDAAPADDEIVFPETSGEFEPVASEAADRDENMSDKDEAEFPDWLGSSSEDAESGGDDADWLQDLSAADSGDESEAAAEPGDAPDWLQDMALDADSAEEGGDDGLEWMSDLESEAAAEPGDAPDWLSDMQPQDESSDDDPPTLDFDDPADAGLEWMSDLEGEAAAEPGDAPDWLSDMQPADAEAAAEPQAEAATEGETGEADEAGFEWMSDLEGDADAEPVAAEPGDTPDWLSDMQPANVEAAAEPQAEAAPEDEAGEAGFEWMSDLEGDADAEPVAADTPDWLQDIAPDDVEAAPEPVATVEDDAPDWLSDIGEEANEAALMDSVEDAEAAADEYDWEPAEETEDDAESATRGMTGWLNEIKATSEQQAAQAEPEEDPAASFEWVGDADESAEDDAGAVAEPIAGDDSEFSWISDLNTEEEPQPETASEIVDDVVDAAALAATAAAASELAGVETGEETPEWLGELGDSYTEPEELQAFAENAEYDEPEAVDEDWSPEEPAPTETATQRTDWPDDEFDAVLSEGSPDNETEHTPAENAPDWLNAMVPGLDLDYEAEEDAPLEHESGVDHAATSEFNWLNDIVEEETGQMAAITEVDGERVPRFVFSRQPAWLRRLLNPSSDNDNDAQSDDWLKDDLPIDENDLDLPDWLK
jgi:hypothetical protein